MIKDRAVSKWIVWLGDGSTRTNRWKSIADGQIVAIAVLYDKPYARVMYGNEYYAKDGQSWGQSEDPSELSGAVKRSHPFLPDDEWEHIRQEVHRMISEWQR